MLINTFQVSRNMLRIPLGNSLSVCPSIISRTIIGPFSVILLANSNVLRRIGTIKTKGWCCLSRKVRFALSPWNLEWRDFIRRTIAVLLSPISPDNGNSVHNILLMAMKSNPPSFSRSLTDCYVFLTEDHVPVPSPFWLPLAPSSFFFC